MKVSHIANNMPAVVPTKDTAPGSTRTTSSSPATMMASGATCHTGDSPSLSVQQVSHQMGSGDFDTACVEQIHSAIQNDTLKMDAGEIADATFSDAQSLLSTRLKGV